MVTFLLHISSAFHNVVARSKTDRPKVTVCRPAIGRKKDPDVRQFNPAARQPIASKEQYRPTFAICHLPFAILGRAGPHQSTNPLIHQSTNPSIHQSTNPPIHQSINPPIHQSTNPLIHAPSYESEP